MENAYLIAGMQLDVLLKLIFRNGVSPHPRYLLRTLFLLQSGAWTSVLNAFETVRCGRRERATPVPEDPVFIVSHWRTGSTFLHQCLTCDPRFTVPTLLQCCYPRSFVTARRYAEPIMKALVPRHRPMDNVRLGPGEPQEDEDAVFRMTGISPLERMIFPHSGDYFLYKNTKGLPDDPRARERWRNAFVEFVRKLAAHSSGGRVVLKNPFNAMRVPELAEMFPRAKFIHIYRDPRAVIPSTVNMWSIVGRQNTLRADWRPPAFEQVVDVFSEIQSGLYRALDTLPAQRTVHVRFEDFEKAPLDHTRALYEHVGVAFDPAARERLTAFLGTLRDYKKNAYSLSAEQTAYIESKLSAHLERGGYRR